MSKSNVKRFWGGASLGLVKEIGESLSKLGFNPVPKVEKEGAVYIWSKSLNDKFNISLHVSPVDRKGLDVTFDVDLVVESPFFSIVEETLAIWKCDPWYRDVDDKNIPSLGAMYFLIVPLRWLLLNATPSIERNYWNVIGGEYSSCVKQLVEDYRSHGAPFVEEINEVSIVEFLRKIDCYTGGSGVPPPISPDKYCYAAILLKYLGDVEGALNELDIGLKNEMASIQRNWPVGSEGYSDAVEMTKCRYEKYRRFVVTASQPSEGA